MRRVYLISFLTLLLSCQKKEEPLQTGEPVFVRLEEQSTGLQFTNELKLNSEFDVFRYRNYYNGGGVAIADINNDGLADVFLVSNMGKNKLFLNKGNWKFEDITEKAGVGGSKVWSTGVSIADVNADGWLDIYVCNSGDIKGNFRQNELFINNKNSTFTESAQQVGLADNGFSTHAVFFDYDKDGDLDCYVLNNSFRPVSSLGYKNLRDVRDPDGGDHLYKNNDGIFADVSEQAGIFGSVIGFGLGVTVGDINQDGWDDLYISNDFYERDYIYINDGKGGFTECLPSYMGHISMFSMGTDLADINNDGYLDVFSTDMLPSDNYRLKTLTEFESYDTYELRIKNGYYHQFMRNMLHINNQDGTFSEIGQYAHVDASDWSWGALIVDLDNDLSKEIFVCNGIYKDLTDQDFVSFLGSSENMRRAIEGKKVDFQEFINKMTSTKLSNCLFVNNGDLQFSNEAVDWGLGEPSFSNGAAYGDLDNDGDLDLVVNNVNQELFVYQNQTAQLNKSHSISISFKGEGKNSFGLGAKVTAYVGGNLIYQENFPTRGFQSSMDYKIILGVGNNSVIDSILVRWPSGLSELKKSITANSTLLFKEIDAKPFVGEKQVDESPLLTKVDINTVEHQENNFNDFDFERLKYNMLSTQGPAFAKADLNNDGLDDIFIGGARNKLGTIFLQQNDNTFKPLLNHFLKEDSLCEDVDAVFFDCDNDNDLDLYVVSGGSEAEPHSLQLVDRLYENIGFKNGSPIFIKSNKLPVNNKSGSCVSPADIDMDGDLDLFVGTRAKINYYGYLCDQYIYQNDGKGNFSDITDSYAPQLHHLGMVTDAVWFDYDDDGFQDLMIVGEWMPIQFYKNDGKSLRRIIINGLEKTDGWWNRIIKADLDNDGDMDFVLGNVGLNTKFRPALNSPLKLYVNDFDQNGFLDPIMTFTQNGKDLPLAMRQDIIQQMSSMKKQFLYYKDYANKSVTDFLEPNLLKNSSVSYFYEPHTSILMNEPNGFKLIPLPAKAQYAPVFGIEVADINRDGINDILLGGNFYATKPEVGRYDAVYGLALLGDGKGSFTPLFSKQSGLIIKGEIRNISLLRGKKKNNIIFLRNNSSPVFYQLN